MSTGPAISVTALTKHYPGVQALTALDLEVPAGSIYGFLGPNGAGKSTTLKLLAGLIRPTSGGATIAGVPLTAGAAFRREVGFLAQEPRFYDWMTARETLRYVASLYPDPAARTREWISKVIETVGLSDAAERRTGTFSGGMRQRLGIAQALVGRPSVLLLDEPVSSLDPIGRREVLDLMKALKGQATIFYSTHILEDVERVSDHVAILDKGRLIRAAPTSDLLGSFTRDCLSVIALGAVDATAAKLAEIPGVSAVDLAERRGDSRRFLLRIDPANAPEIQRAVMRFAIDNDLTLTENELVRLGLEDVFLRLVDGKERAS